MDATTSGHTPPERNYLKIVSEGLWTVLLEFIYYLYSTYILT
nr:MAG TPA: hypothetical protein [Caudoviricetes sp.]